MEVVAENGLRGLTHRAVDRKAGLPEGSCSGSLRTRSALQGALASFVAARREDDVRRLVAEIAHHGEGLAKAQATTPPPFQHWLGSRHRVVEGRSVSGRVDLGCRRIITK